MWLMNYDYDTGNLSPEQEEALKWAADQTPPLSDEEIEEIGREWHKAMEGMDLEKETQAIEDFFLKNRQSLIDDYFKKVG